MISSNQYSVISHRLTGIDDHALKTDSEERTYGT